MHGKFTIFMRLFLLLVPQGQVPSDTCEDFLHLEREALCGERSTSKFRYYHLF